MAILDVCPRCYGQPRDVKGEMCSTCLGYGVVYPVFEPCSRCEGKGCGYCYNGTLAFPQPFTHRPTTRYSRTEIEQAQRWLRSGFPPDVEEDGYYRALGLIAGLVIISEMFTEESTEPGDWFQNILRDADALVIDPSGMYLEHGDEGVRIYRFPLI